MRKFVGLFICILCVSVGTSLAQDKVHLGLGVGLATNSADVTGDGSDEDIEGDGGFIVFSGYMDNGFLWRFNLSGTQEDTTEEGLDFESKLARIDGSVGFMFRRKSVFRPILHGGIANVIVTQDVEGIEFVDDSSIVITVGAGFEAGKDHHFFYFDANFDPGHEVDVEALGINFGTSEFDLTEFHLGYLYRF